MGQDKPDRQSTNTALQDSTGVQSSGPSTVNSDNTAGASDNSMATSGKKNEHGDRQQVDVTKGDGNGDGDVQSEGNSQENQEKGGDEKHAKTHKAHKSSNKEKRIYNITYGTLDLTPTPSLEELEADRKQSKSSFGILAFLMLIMFIGFTMFVATLLLNRSLDLRRRRLDSLQRELDGLILKNKKNETLKKRLAIVDRLEFKTYDPKHTLEYWQQRIEGYGLLTSISIGQDLTFTIEGEGDSVESLAELWYLLSVDPAVDTVTLSSFTAGDEEATFVFNGRLNTNVFSNNNL